MSVVLKLGIAQLSLATEGNLFSEYAVLVQARNGSGIYNPPAEQLKCLVLVNLDALSGFQVTNRTSGIPAAVIMLLKKAGARGVLTSNGRMMCLDWSDNSSADAVAKKVVEAFKQLDVRLETKVI